MITVSSSIMENNPKPKLKLHGTSSADSANSGQFPLESMPYTQSPTPTDKSPTPTDKTTSWASEVALQSPPQSPLPRPSKLTRNERAQTLSVSGSFDIGKRVFYIDGDDNVHNASIKKTDYDDKTHTYYTIDVNGTQMFNVHHTALSEVHPTVNRVLNILNLHDETDHFLRKKYPTLTEFEYFLQLSFEAIKAFHKINGELKEPRFKRSDRQEFIILRRWTEEKTNQNQDDGKINWRCFNEESFNFLREQAPKQDLISVLKELGIDNDKVRNTLKAKSIQSPAHFVLKPKSWYNKLEDESGTEEYQQQPRELLFNGSEKIAIEKFKQWYKFHSMGYLPSDWIVSFRNDDVHPKQRDLRNVLRAIGVNADAIAALAMNDVRDIPTLNRESKWWKTETKRDSSSIVGRIPWMRSGEQDSRSDEWKLMGLSRNDASDIISFRHWYHLYIAGKPNMKDWTAEFNSAHFNSFLQRYQPGDNFRLSFWWKFQMHDRFTFSQERHDYYDMLQKANEAGDVSDKQRYYLMKYYKEKREKIQLVEEITSRHNEGLGDCTQQEERLQELFDLDEKRADEKDKGDLLFGQQFCQFFFSAFLVLVLLCSWFCTTIYFMYDFNHEDEHPGYEYVTFIHNVLFGLVTAVVIQELGEEASETSLYYRFLPTYRDQRRRRKEYQILNHLNIRRRGGVENLLRVWGDIVQFAKSYLMAIILWSTRLYIMCWIFLGAVSLAFGAIEGVDTDNPLYTTGQTWLGIAVTIGYTYFGLSGKVVPQQDGDDKTDEKKNGAAIQRTIDGSGGTNGREGAGNTDERKDGVNRRGGKTDPAKDTDAQGGTIGRIMGLNGEGESFSHETGGPSVTFETTTMMNEEGRGGSLQQQKSELPSMSELPSISRGNVIHESADRYISPLLSYEQCDDQFNHSKLSEDEGNRNETGLTDTFSVSLAAAAQDLPKESKAWLSLLMMAVQSTGTTSGGPNETRQDQMEKGVLDDKTDS